MVNELIVDFPRRSYYDRYYMRPQVRESNNPVGQGRSQHPAFDFHDKRRSHRCDEQDRHRFRSSIQPYASSRRSSRSSLTTRSVHFAETSLLYIVNKHEDRDDVQRDDLWYTQLDLDLMKLAAQEDVLKVREQMSAGVFIDYLGEDDDTAEEGSSIVCIMGIESRLTRERALEVKACRARCALAVLKEQERQKMMDLSSSPDMIALASLSQSRDAALRARKLGMLHQQCVKPSRR
jgi:hypothetical protein